LHQSISTFKQNNNYTNFLSLYEYAFSLPSCCTKSLVASL